MHLASAITLSQRGATPFHPCPPCTGVARVTATPHETPIRFPGRNDLLDATARMATTDELGPCNVLRGLRGPQASDSAPSLAMEILGDSHRLAHARATCPVYIILLGSLQGAFRTHPPRRGWPSRPEAEANNPPARTVERLQPALVESSCFQLTIVSATHEM